MGYVVAGKEYLRVKRTAFFLCFAVLCSIDCLIELNFRCFLLIPSGVYVHVNPCLIFRSGLHLLLFFFFPHSVLLACVDPKVLQALKVGRKTSIW